MSAEPIADEMSGPWQPDPVRQRLGDYTLEDLLSLPPDAPRVELVDGVIHVVPSPTEDHQDISGLLWSWLRAHAPRYQLSAQRGPSGRREYELIAESPKLLELTKLFPLRLPIAEITP